MGAVPTPDMASLNPHKAVMNTIEKFWTQVLPRIS
jgi:hypothetical protein